MTSAGPVKAAATPNHKKLLAFNIIALATTMLILPACSTVTVNKQASAKTISTQRGNIVTGNKLSTDTASTLLSAGLDEQACMQYFDLCLSQLTDSMLNPSYQPALAIFSELHYAKARQLAETQSCRNALARPPIDPYYANAPLAPEQLEAQQKDTNTCLINYQQRLFDAVKYSYTYLFYDTLEHDFEGADDIKGSQRRLQQIPNDVDIQTQDIYKAASNDVITQLYESTDDS